MNNLIDNLFPSPGGQLNDFAPVTKKDGRRDKPINCFFSRHSTSCCKPLEDLIIKDKNSYGHQQVVIKDLSAVPGGFSELSQPKAGSLESDAEQNRHFSSANSAGSDGERPLKHLRGREDCLMLTIRKLKKQNPTLVSKRKIKLFNSIISADNTATPPKKLKSVTQSDLDQNEVKKLLEKREKERIRKAAYRQTPKGKESAAKATKKYRSSEKGQKKIIEHRLKYKKSPKGIISSAISNAKSNATVSALKLGQGMREARRLGTVAADDEKKDLLKVFHIPWLQK